MSQQSTSIPLGCFLVAIVLVVCGTCGINWYRASVQAEVYRREGIEISTWEVMWGSKPAERSIHMKEK